MVYDVHISWVLFVIFVKTLPVPLFSFFFSLLLLKIEQIQTGKKFDILIMVFLWLLPSKICATHTQKESICVCFTLSIIFIYGFDVPYTWISMMHPSMYMIINNRMHLFMQQNKFNFSMNKKICFSSHHMQKKSIVNHIYTIKNLFFIVKNISC